MYVLSLKPVAAMALNCNVMLLIDIENSIKESLLSVFHSAAGDSCPCAQVCVDACSDVIVPAGGSRGRRNVREDVTRASHAKSHSVVTSVRTPPAETSSMR